MNKRSGYTFFELLTVIGVTIIFGSVALLNLPTGLKTKLEVENAISSLKSNLILIQQRSISQENGSKWGMHIDASTPGRHFYQIFYGDTYESGTVVETVYLPDGAIFMSPANGNTEDIIFEKVTGKTEGGHSIIIGLEAVSRDPLLIAANNNLQSEILLARQNAVNQLNDADWGVHADAFASAGDNYKLFYGNSFSAGTQVDSVNLPGGIIFLSPADGHTGDMIFQKGTGEILVGDSIVLGTVALDAGNSGNIIIAPGTGLVEQLKSVSVFDASLSLSPASGTSQPGGSVGTDVSMSIISGVPDLTSFFTSNLPNGATAAFSPASCSPTCVSNLTIQTSQSTPAGNYPITVYAAAGGLFKSADFNLAVNVLSVPGSPTGLTGNSGNRQVFLSWQAPAITGGSPVTDYKIYRGTASGGEVFLADAGAVLSYSDDGLNNGTTYYYKVSAQNSVGEGVLSSEISLSPSSSNISGWAWSGNIGWISFNCSNTGICGAVNYGVSVDPGSGLMSGYAWSENVGWISFNSPELSGCPSGICEARITGGLIGSFPKNISGWAKILSSGSWIHLSGTGQDGSSYAVQLASDKTFSGWSWDPDMAGWIHWSGILYGVRGVW